MAGTVSKTVGRGNAMGSETSAIRQLIQEQWASWGRSVAEAQREEASDLSQWPLCLCGDSVVEARQSLESWAGLLNRGLQHDQRVRIPPLPPTVPGRASVARVAEQPALNRLGVGSSPTGRTNDLGLRIADWRTAELS